MKHLSWKYIAGLVDGEGCLDFQVGRSRYTRADGSNACYLYLTPRLRLALVASCRPLIDLLANQCGGNVFEDKRTKYNPNWQDALYWQLENTRLRGTLQRIIPFLHIKREQAKFLLWLIDNMRGKTVKQHGMEKLDAARRVAREEMKAMKRDPQRLSERAIENVLRTLD